MPRPNDSLAVVRNSLAAGQDRAFRVFSTVQDQQSRELSQGHIAKRAKRLRVEEAELKLPRVISMDACQVGLEGLQPDQLAIIMNKLQARMDVPTARLEDRINLQCLTHQPCKCAGIAWLPEKSSVRAGQSNVLAAS